MTSNEELGDAIESLTESVTKMLDRMETYETTLTRIVELCGKHRHTQLANEILRLMTEQGYGDGTV